MNEEIFSAEILMINLDKLLTNLHSIKYFIQKNPNNKEYNKRVTDWFLSLQNPPQSN